MKPFDIELAKQGKPVCLRNGKKARIVCFDAKNGDYPILALVETGEREATMYVNERGENRVHPKYDLMMASEKKERWMNVYHNEKGEYWSEQVLFSTKKEAIDFVHDHTQYVTTVKIEWEE